MKFLTLYVSIAALLSGALAQAAPLDILPAVDPLQAPPGSVLVLTATLQNTTGEVLYLNSVSADVAPELAGADIFDDYQAAAPDSLLPGEGWEGPVLRLTVAPDAPLSTTHLVGMSFTGGGNPYDDQSIGLFYLTVNDSLTTSGVPDGRGHGAPGPLSAAPNPTRDTATIRFALATAQRVQVDVYNVSGSRVRALVDGPLDAGAQSLVWDGRAADGTRVAPGLYFVRVRSAEGLRHTKVVIVP